MNNTFAKYIIGGFISYGIKIILTYTVINFFDLWYFYAYLFSLGVVIFINFVINSFFIFKVSDFNVIRIIKYVVSIFIFNSLDAGLVVILTDKFFLYYLLSITISTIVIFLVKFIINKYFIFNTNSNYNSNVNTDNKNIFSSKAYLKEHDKPYLKGYEKVVIEKYFTSNMKILDLGCGAGRTSKILSDMGCRVIGVDISDNLIDLAKQKYPNLDFRIGDATSLDFEDNYFDAVLFSFNGIDYVHPRKLRLQVLEEINRVLKNGGLFVYSSHNALNIPRTKISILTFLNSLLTLRIFSYYRNEKHDLGDIVTYYGNIWSEEKDLNKHGLVLIDCVGVGSVSSIKNKLLLSLLSKHIMYVAKSNNQ